MPSVLFVCTANRFRSPLAAAMLRKALQEAGLATAWRVDSAGTWAMPGEPVLESTSTAARLFDIDLSRHRALRVSRQLLSEYDLILVMQASHREALLTEFPNLKEHIHLFSEAVEGRFYDIPDALESNESSLEISRELDGLIRGGLDQICALAIQLHNINERSKESYG